MSKMFQKMKKKKRKQKKKDMFMFWTIGQTKQSEDIDSGNGKLLKAFSTML